MVERVLAWFNKELNGLHQAALLLALSSFASQVLALIRDRLLAAEFGAGRSLDIYYASFRVPDLVYVSIASFVSVTILIPMLLQKLERDRLVAREFLGQVLSAFLLVMVVASLVLLVLAPYLATLVAPGFEAGERELLVTTMRIMLLSPLLLGLSNLFGAVTQSLRRFFIYALSPLLYNLGIIVGILMFYPALGLPGLAYGVVLGAFLHLIIQLPTVFASGLMPRLVWRFDWPELKRVILTSLPRTLALSAQQVALLVLIALASLFAAGSVSVFNLAMNLQGVPLMIIGVSYSVAAFPTLAQLFHKGEKEQFVRQVILALRHILFWSTPAVVLFIVLRAQIVRVVFGAGNFDWSNTRLTAAALALFIISLIGQSIVLLLVRGYYASGRTITPLLVNIGSAVLIVILALVLVWFFNTSHILPEVMETLLRVRGLEGTVILVLPLAFSLGMILNALALWWLFQRDFGDFGAIVDRAIAQSIIGSLLAGLVAYQALIWLAPLLDLNTFIGIALQGFIAGVLGLLILYLALKYFNNKELAEIESSFKRKFWRVQVIAPEQEGL